MIVLILSAHRYSEELKAVWQERKEIKEASVAEETESLVKADEITPEHAMKLESKKELTVPEEQQLKGNMLLGQIAIAWRN